MSSNKTIFMSSIVAILSLLVGGMVVYAAISTQLDIKGSAEFQPESWKVQFKESSLSTPTTGDGLTGTAMVATAPTLTDTIIEDFKIVLKQPGDSVTYNFYIENTGSLDAILSTYSSGSPTCTGTGATATADEAIVCGTNLKYTFSYVGGDLTENGLSANQTVAESDFLKKNTEVELELKLEYANTATENPTNTVTIGGLNKTLIYTVNQ